MHALTLLITALLIFALAYRLYSKFIIARVRNHYGKGKQANLVRDAQVKVAETIKFGGWFDTDDFHLVKGHYEAVGQIEIGKRFAKKYQEIVSKRNRGNSGSR